MNRGYLKLWRKFQDHPFWKEKRIYSKAEAWIDLLWEAQHSNDPIKVIIKMKVLICHRGQSLKSMETWARRWNWSKSKVKRFFDLLCELNQVELKNETVTTRITILNYSDYNEMRNANETDMKRNRNAIETQSNTDKNVNNVNNVNNDKENTPLEDKFFDLFWLNYPKKVGKEAARKAWKKIRRPAEVIEKIKNKLPEQMDSIQWNKENGQYIPNPATYLNQGRWEDELNG